MSTNSTNVIITDSLCACRAVHTRRVHHHSFPEIHVEGLTAGDAAARLADRLGGLLDTVSSEPDRQLIEDAIGDVRTFIDRNPPSELADVLDESPETVDTGPSRVFDVRPLGAELSDASSTVLVRTEGLEVVRMIVRRDREVPTHESQGETTVQCLEGLIDFHVAGRTHRLIPGQLVHLREGESHAMVALEDTSLLVTSRR